MLPSVLRDGVDLSACVKVQRTANLLGRSTEDRPAASTVQCTLPVSPPSAINAPQRGNQAKFNLHLPREVVSFATNGREEGGQTFDYNYPLRRARTPNATSSGTASSRIERRMFIAAPSQDCLIGG